MAQINGTRPSGLREKLIGVVQPWEGTPFRRAVHLIWRTYGTAEAVPFHNRANPRVFPQPASVISRNFVA